MTPSGVFLTNFESCVHYQIQFGENPIKMLLKTREPIFHGHHGDTPFHGLSQDREFSMKLNP